DISSYLHNKARQIFLYKIVSFYWYGNNCVGSALADDRVERHHRDPRPEEARVMRERTDTAWCIFCDLDHEEPLLGERETGVSTLTYPVIERHPCRFPHLCRHPCRT